MRNRTILGIVCIFLSLLITFGFSPLINRLLGGDMTVIRLSRDVRQGEEITADCTESVKVKKSTVPSGVILNLKDIKGKYALSDLYAGDYLKKEKLSGTGNSVKEAFASLDGDKSAVSFTVKSLAAGATSSGKTTLLNALLDTVPDGKRIFTIESGSRELSLVKKKDGKVVNNVVHTLSRPSEDEGLNIAQEDLVVASLRFDPDIVVVGEIRDSEAYSAVEASLTGHTVVSTIHALAADAAHTRLALLCQKKFPIKFETSLSQAAQAFPLVVFAHRLEDSNRKIMDISECIVSGDGNRQYRTLFRYAITENSIKNGKYVIKGHFEQPEIMSDSLKKRLLQYGAPADVLKKFETKGADYSGV